MLDRFAANYADARARFLDAAVRAEARVTHFPLAGYRGAGGEELAIDVAWVGAPDAAGVLVVSSGVHGVEGFCGSAAQGALLLDTDTRASLDRRGLALLLIHAVNPYGFSHLHRTNEDNIDLNRNAIDFGRPLPADAGYAALHALLVPATWPPTAENEAQLGAQLQRLGQRAFMAAVGSGQYAYADGLFYGGAAPSWSVRTVSEILRTMAARARRVGWIDVHTGLGPYGHGEKIHVDPSPEAIARARRWWGADVTSAGTADSVTGDVSGPVFTLARACCPGEVTAMGLEYGTLPWQDVANALRADAWRRRHPDAPKEIRQLIGRQLRDAFYCDSADWKGMVLGQARVAVLQALRGLEDPA